MTEQSHPPGPEPRVALVTGGGSGIGRATALAFAANGTRVMVADIDEHSGEQTAATIRERGGDAAFTRTDVAVAHEVAAMVRDTLARFGRIDCAFNNAGIEGQFTALADYPEDVWQRVIAINLTGVWLCLKHEIPVMRDQGGGAIVNMASIAGLVGTPLQAAYVASKHGVVGLTKTAALGYAEDRVRVNAVCPGIVETPMLQRAIAELPSFATHAPTAQPLGRVGQPEEIAAAVVWLCSDAASFVTGAALPVDGGWTAR